VRHEQSTVNGNSVCSPQIGIFHSHHEITWLNGICHPYSWQSF